MKLARRSFITGAAALIAGRAAAHHGYMAWDYDNPITLEGWISNPMDGFPHWEFWMRVDGEDWSVDIGDQFTLQKAGFQKDGKEFTRNRQVRVEGYRPVDQKVLRILPTSIQLDDEEPREIVVSG